MKTPIGNLPTIDAIDTSGLSDQVQMDRLFSVDRQAWKAEAEELKKYFDIFGDQLPEGIRQELAALQSRLQEPE